MKKITELPVWQELKNHQAEIASQKMQNWFAEDPNRFSRFSLHVEGLLLDYSKNWLLPHTLFLLNKLAQDVNLAHKIQGLFDGHHINTSENRPALHTALRNRSASPVMVNNQNIMNDIQLTLQKMREFTRKIRNQELRGATDKPITDIINIGIGGSHLGPMLTTHALAHFAKKELTCHFISNIDPAHIQEVLERIDPETSLFIISSKSFTTLETTTNANTFKKWFINKLGIENLSKHFVAITAAHEKAIQFGIQEEFIFPLWEWVGGRYSIWSAIALPLALLIGMDHFEDFLKGAHAIDQHFRQSEFVTNMPVILALMEIWYVNFFHANNRAIVPYTHALTHLRPYLQQADMESNGKNTSHNGDLLDYATGSIIWGEQGCNGQHAFHQLLHQGQHLIPVDFILVGKNNHDLDHHHDILVASGLSQAQALMQGKTFHQALAELLQEGYTPEQANYLAQHKTLPGNRPSNTLFIEEINPYNLGSLLALYEHKIFVQSAIWDINCFDQWGVELGKQLLPQILAELYSPAKDLSHDSSTQGLIAHYKKLRKAEDEAL